MAIAGTNIPLNTAEGEDKLTITEKVTSAYFSTGDGELLASAIITESIANDNETYYVGISHVSSSTTTEFHVAYGNVNGYGGNSDGGNVKSPTEVIYKQWANILLAPSEVTGGFKISQAGSHADALSGKDEGIYVLIGERAQQLDRLNKKNWTIFLTGSKGDHASTPTGTTTLKLTDDSTGDSPTATPMGDRYNIVSGSDGTVSGSGATHRTFGWYYPDAGALVFSENELSQSMPGNFLGMGSEDVVEFVGATPAINEKFQGFAGPSGSDKNMNTALRFVNCLKSGQTNGDVGKLKFRDEEDQISTQYFCRIKSGHMNFSNNPTFVSGSLNELRHTSMKVNPCTYITQVQLFNPRGDIVAVGNLSTPLKKNFSSEATVKVKLTY